VATPELLASVAALPPARDEPDVTVGELDVVEPTFSFWRFLRRWRRLLGLGIGLVVIDSVTGKVAGGPEIHARGFVEDDSTFEEIIPALVQALDQAVANGVDDSHQLQQTIRRVVGRWVNSKHRRRPMIIPVVIEA